MIHDVGGQTGYGAPDLKSPPGVDGSAFAARWEACVFAAMRALGAAGVMKNSDQFRHAVERVDAEAYFSHGYYGRWLGGLETLLCEAGELSRETLDARVAELAVSLGATNQQVANLLEDGSIASRVLPASEVETFAASRNAGSSVRYISQPPKYRLGQQVLASGYQGEGNEDEMRPRHTRLPGYAKGCAGTVVALHGGWVLPDTNAHLGCEQPAHLYTIAFDARDLYGPDAEADVVVHLDLFEPYLTLLENP